MKSFKEFLKEDTFITDRDKISKLLIDAGFKPNRYNIRDNGTVDFTQDFYISRDVRDSLVNNGKLRFKIGRVETQCLMINAGLTTLEGAPDHVGASFECDNNLLTTFEFAPRIIKGNLECYANKSITSLIGIADSFDEIGGSFLMSLSNVKSGGLGLLQIPGLKGILEQGYFAEEQWQIIHKYIGTDNIIECQSELIEAGFEEFAQL